MKSYSPVELAEIFARIAPNSGLLIPAPSPMPTSRKGGPAVCVYLRYSDIETGTVDLEQRYWGLLQQTPVVSAIAVLATINGILSEYRMGHAEVHRTLNERFLSPDLRVKEIVHLECDELQH